MTDDTLNVYGLTIVLLTLISGLPHVVGAVESGNITVVKYLKLLSYFISIYYFTHYIDRSSVNNPDCIPHRSTAIPDHRRAPRNFVRRCSC